MTDHVSGSESQGQEEVKLSPLIVRVFAFVLVLGLLLFGLSGRLDWVQGWAWLIANLIALLIGVIVVPKDPEMLHERTTMKQDAKNWDKVIATILSVCTPLGLIIPAALLW